jgi:hypothetical protein
MGEAIVAALAALPDTHVVAVTRSTQWRAPAVGVTVEIGDPGDPAFLAAVAVRSGDVDGVIKLLVEDYRLNGWKYESEKYISLAALASVITMVVQLPLESSIYDVTIEPTNRAAPERLA